MRKEQIAAQLYTVRESLKTGEALAEAFARIAAIGYSAVQLSGVGNVEPEKIRDEAEKKKLKIVVTHTAYDKILKEPERVVREHKLWGCDTIGLGSMPDSYRTGVEGYRSFCETFGRLAKLYAAQGLRLVYHNHDFELQKYDGVTGLEIILEGARAYGYEIEPDIYWLQAGGADPARWIAKMAGCASVVHLKDYGIIDRKPVFCEVGEGNIYWPEIFDVCDKIGIRWAAVEQDVCPGDPFDSLALSFRNIMTLIGERQ